MTFNYVEGNTTVRDIVQTVVAQLTTGTNSWTKEGEVVDTEGVVKSAVLSTTTSFNKKFYLKITRPEGSVNYITMQIGTAFENTSGTLILTGNCSEEARYAWYRNVDDLYIGEWLPVQYWISFNTDFMNIVLQGDPSVDEAPYNHYLISYAYIGALEGYEGADADEDYNWCMTVGSDIFLTDYPKTFGNRTGTGVTDIVVVGTRTGTPYQAHNVSYNCESIHTDKNYIGPSNWTHKYHASQVTVSHAYDRERGKLQNMLIMDKSAAFHLDEFKDTSDPDETKVYKMFNLNAPYSFINNGANPLYGIAMRIS